MSQHTIDKNIRVIDDSSRSGSSSELSSNDSLLEKSVSQSAEFPIMIQLKRKLEPTFLIIDDNNSIITIIKNMIKKLLPSSKSIISTSGESALVKILEWAKDGHCFHKIFLDIKMAEGKWNGVETAKEIRCLELDHHVTGNFIVGMKTEDDIDDLSYYLEHGMDVVINKLKVNEMKEILGPEIESSNLDILK